MTEKREANLDNVRVKTSGAPHPEHVRNFLGCVKSRQRPVFDAEAGHHVSSVAHLGNIACRTDRKLTWDPVKEQVTSDKAADEFVGVEYRRPWKLPFAKRA